MEALWTKIKVISSFGKSGIDSQTLKDANINFNLKTIILGEEGEEATGNAELSLGIGFVSGFLIYIFIFMYGAMVMRGVIEEKTNRIVEVIISSIKPFQLMMGKIVGVALDHVNLFFFNSQLICNYLIKVEKKSCLLLTLKLLIIFFVLLEINQSTNIFVSFDFVLGHLLGLIGITP